MKKEIIPKEYRAPNNNLSWADNDLLNAAKREDLEDIKTALKNGANIDAGTMYLLEALHSATEKKNLPIVRFLVNKGARLDKRTNISESIPLHFAANDKNPDLEIIKLLTTPHTVNVGDICNYTPLHHAAQHGNINVLKFLLEKGADPTRLTQFKDKPSDLATDETVRNFLLEAEKNWEKKLPSSNPNQTTEKVEVKPQEKKEEKKEKLVEAQLVSLPKKENPAQNPQANKKLLESSSSDNLQRLKDAFAEGADVEAKGGENEDMALHIAASNGHGEIVKYLINHQKANINVKNKIGLTPLHYAAGNNKLGVVKLLVNYKHLNIDQRDEFGRNAFYLACENNNIDIVKFLAQQSGVNVNAKDINGATPLHAASSAGHIDTVKFLVNEQKVDVNQKDDTDTTPLHDAAENGCLDVVRFLLEKGANPTSKTKQNSKPSDLAKSSELKNLLLNAEKTWGKKNPTSGVNKPDSKGKVSKPEVH